MKPLDDLIHDATRLAGDGISAAAQPLHFRTRADILQGDLTGSEAEA